MFKAQFLKASSKVKNKTDNFNSLGAEKNIFFYVLNKYKCVTNVST